MKIQFFFPHTKFVENTVGEVVTYVLGKFTQVTCWALNCVKFPCMHGTENSNFRVVSPATTYLIPMLIFALKKNMFTLPAWLSSLTVYDDFISVHKSVCHFCL